MPENDAAGRVAVRWFGSSGGTATDLIQDIIREEQDAEGVARKACEIVWTFADRGMFYSGDWRRRLEAEIAELIRKGRTDAN